MLQTGQSGAFACCFYLLFIFFFFFPSLCCFVFVLSLRRTCDWGYSRPGAISISFSETDYISFYCNLNITRPIGIKIYERNVAVWYFFFCIRWLFIVTFRITAPLLWRSYIVEWSEIVLPDINWVKNLWDWNGFIGRNEEEGSSLFRY